jgi:hypothetical protein
MSVHHPALPIAALARRHPGLTPAILLQRHFRDRPAYTEATVCLSRHHDNLLTSIEKTMTNRWQRLPERESYFSGRRVHEVALEENRRKLEWRG